MNEAESEGERERESLYKVVSKKETTKQMKTIQNNCSRVGLSAVGLHVAQMIYFMFFSSSSTHSEIIWL